jgi:phenylalanyl-tRNA synthetase beta chain
MANPMTADQEYLRPNLRVNLLAALANNLRHEEGGIRLFELGKTYLPQPQDLPREPDILCAVSSGPRAEKSWQGEGASMDFFDAKGIVEGLLSQLGLEASFAPGTDEGLHSGKQATIMVGDKKLGVVGELHPKVLAAYEIPQAASLFEIDLEALLPLTTAHKMFQPIPKFPAIVRDIALVVDNGVTHRQVQDIVSSFSLVKQVTVFDVYSGEPVPAGQKSLAYRITYLSPGHTLTDEEVNRIQQQILKRLSKELGATLRS